MKPILRATAILGSSSFISIVVGLISAKAWAVLLGPGGLGYMGLLQSLLGLTGLVAGIGVGAGLVRSGANALAQGDHTRAAALYRAAWLLMVLMGGLALIVLVTFRTPVSYWMLGSTQHEGSVVLLGVALIFSMASGVQTSALNAYHRIGALAKLAILNSVLGAAVTLALVWLWREEGIAPAIIISACISWAISYFLFRREVGSIGSDPTRSEVLDAARSLIRFGAPYTASMLVGTGVQLLLPILVLHNLGPEDVGYYRAAIAVSISYLGFLLNAMGQDYYPRLSAVSDQPERLVQLVNDQHRLVMLLAVPMILIVLALSPYIVPLIYSPQFSPTVAILEWQLVGDLFKFSSWTMAYVILARSGSVTFFFTELIGGISLLAGSWLGMQWMGLAGLGAGFLAAYIVYYQVVWITVRREIGHVWSRENKRLMLLAVSAASIILVLPLVGLESIRTPLALSFALIASLLSLHALWTETGWWRSTGRLQHNAEK